MGYLFNKLVLLKKSFSFLVTNEFFSYNNGFAFISFCHNYIILFQFFTDLFCYA